jgi:hypothetical protein
MLAKKYEKGRSSNQVVRSDRPIAAIEAPSTYTTLAGLDDTNKSVMLYWYGDGVPNLK